MENEILIYGIYIPETSSFWELDKVKIDTELNHCPYFGFVIGNFGEHVGIDPQTMMGFVIFEARFERSEEIYNRLLALDFTEDLPDIKFYIKA